LHFGQILPSSTKIFRNFRIMHVGSLFANDTPLYLTPDHKWIHWTFYVAGAVLFCLKIEKMEKKLIYCREAGRLGWNTDERNNK